jgi:hypothetical protein
MYVYVRMYVCMYVCMYECMYVCVCMYVCMYVVCMYVRMHACMRTRVCACMSASVYARLCARTACETSTSGQKADTASNRATSMMKAKDHILENVGICMCVYVCASVCDASRQCMHEVDVTRA